MARQACDSKGFTLIEMSIVLVIIGLVVGGVLVGIDLVRAAEVRAQISQIEKYNQAVNTFRGKYGYIPGDLQLNVASQFGFITTACTGTFAFRDGNGFLDGQIRPNIYDQTIGEVQLFWADLSMAGLISETIPNGGVTVTCNYIGVDLVSTQMSEYFPAAKIGRSNMLAVYEADGSNWFSLSEMNAEIGATLDTTANIPVIEAYNIDTKIDDGIPATGNVQATYLHNSQTSISNAPNTTTSGGNSTSCYDTATGMYSITVNGGAGANCALSFKFQ